MGLKNARQFQINIGLKLNFIFHLLYFYLKISLIQANDCLISNNTIITSQWLNNIICIGDNDYKYVNFANFANGDMVVEITSMPEALKRYFFGIKGDGKPLFKNGKYHASIEVSGQDNTNVERNEGEIFSVPIEDKDIFFILEKDMLNYMI